MGDVNDRMLGAGGVVNATPGSGAVSGDFGAIQVLQAATFSAFTETDVSGSLTGVSIPAGVILYNGKGITSFNLSAGRVRAYRR
jgi:hypothetical protein